MTPSPKPKPSPRPDLGRKSLIKTIHVLKKKACLGEDDYRLILERETGKTTCADMSIAELKQVAEALRLLLPGSAAVADYSPKYPPNSYEGKLVALWITAAKAKLIRDGGHSALIEYVWRGQQKPGLLHHADMLQAAPTELKRARIQGLNALLERNGIDPKSP
jgi:hypothetical protein